MAEPVPTVIINDIMDEGPSFLTILERFGLAARSRERLIEDFPNARALLSVSLKDLKEIIYNQNKIYRNHSTPNQRCYINTTQQSYIMAFHRRAIFAIEDAHAKYDVGTLNEFTRDWVDLISENYNAEDPVVTPQSTAFTIEVPKFDGKLELI